MNFPKMDDFTDVFAAFILVTFADIGIEGIMSDIPAFTAVIAVVVLWMLFGALKRAVRRLFRLAIIKTLFLS
jgi:hypothetical protein